MTIWKSGSTVERWIPRIQPPVAGASRTVPCPLAHAGAAQDPDGRSLSPSCRHRAPRLPRAGSADDLLHSQVERLSSPKDRRNVERYRIGFAENTARPCQSTMRRSGRRVMHPRSREAALPRWGFDMRTRPSHRTILPIVAVALACLPTELHAQFAYVVNYTSRDVSGYTIDSTTGALTPISGSPFPAEAAEIGALSVAVDPTGRFAYVLNHGGPDSVSGYAIDPSSGALTFISRFAFPVLTAPTAVAVDPSGRFVYVANATGGAFPGGNVLGFTINSTSGELTPVPGSPFPLPVRSAPRSVAVDPSGRFVYVANSFGTGVSGFRINSTSGALTAISTFPVPVLSDPQSVAVDPSGRFAYVAARSFPFSFLLGYGINSTSGALTPISGLPFPAGSLPESVAVDPSGRFVYVASVVSAGTGLRGNVSGYTMNSTSGELTPVPGSPFPLPEVSLPQSVAVDPSGRFVYVANPSGFPFDFGGNVSGYTIDAVTGALTPMSGSPFVAGTRPVSIAFTGCTAAPTITGVSTSPATLWPPNLKLVDVSVNYEVAAACGEPASCTLSVASNERVNNDHTSPDWVVLDAHRVELRAERSGAGTGRIYNITIRCTDTRGKSATQNTAVTVPHDQPH
jgi:6-phosphogluconolactonase